MRGTLIFVHGTGVREEAFATDWENFQNRAEEFTDLTRDQLVPVTWGPDRRAGIPDGELLNRILPPRGWFGLTESVPDSMAWTVLSFDPLLELRLGGYRHGELEPSAAEDGAGTISTFGTLDLGGTEIAPEEVTAALQFVEQSRELSLAQSSEALVGPQLQAMTARAVIAVLHHRHRDDPPGSAPMAFRNAEAHELLTEEVSRYLGVAEASGGDFGEDFKWFLTAFGRFLRPGLTGFITTFFADVFWHLRCGLIESDIEAAVVKASTAGNTPIVIVAHSLGAIAAVDLLTRKEPILPAVDLLVTYGSQSSLVFITDAMRYLRLDSEVPSGLIRRWVNLYDKNDFLAFRGGPLEPAAQTWIEDEIDSRMPFPDSHGAYVDQKDFWQLINRNWPS